MKGRVALTQLKKMSVFLECLFGEGRFELLMNWIPVYFEFRFKLCACIGLSVELQQLCSEFLIGFERRVSLHFDLCRFAIGCAWLDSSRRDVLSFIVQQDWH